MYIDYVTKNILLELVLLGSENFLRIIENCNKRNLDPKSSEASALFSIKISIENEELSFNPSREEVLGSLTLLMDQTMQVVELKRFDENELFSKFTQ